LKKYSINSHTHIKEEYSDKSTRYHFYSAGKALIFSSDELHPYASADLHIHTVTVLLHFWLLEITQGRIIFWNYLFQVDKRISHIQNLSRGYNLNPDNIFV
jgi:hypothetical protein